MESSSIGWTHHTQNFWRGCNKVSRECRHCYIARWLLLHGLEPFGGPVRTTTTWRDPFTWDREAGERGVRERVFTCSLSDFFHDGADEWRPEAWKAIKACTNLDWLVLTKRPELVLDRLPPDWGTGYPNVWLGVTCGHPDSYWRLDALRRIPAVLKFVSAEPLLARLDFRPWLSWIDWIITGCEQAARGKRQVMDMDWVRDVERQCEEAGKLHFFKQAYLVDDSGEEYGTPCETPHLDGEVVQEVPQSRFAMSLL